MSASSACAQQRGIGAELGRSDLDRLKRRRHHAHLQLRLDDLFHEGPHLPEKATEHNSLGVEDIDEPRQARAEPATALLHGGQRDGVTPGRLPEQSGDGFRPVAPLRSSRAAEERRSGDLGLPSSPSPHSDSGRPWGSPGRVPPRRRIRPHLPKDAPVDDQPAADFDFARQVDEVISAGHAAPPHVYSAERSEVRLVGDEDRQIGPEPCSDETSEWDVAPSQIRSEVHEPVSPSDYFGHRDADAGDPATRGNQTPLRCPDELPDVFDRLIGRAAPRLCAEVRAM